MIPFAFSLFQGAVLAYNGTGYVKIDAQYARELYANLSQEAAVLGNHGHPNAQLVARNAICLVEAINEHVRFVAEVRRRDGMRAGR